MRTSESIAEGRDNNFNLLRIAAASAVIVSHSFPLALGPLANEPLHEWLEPFDLGKAAVRIFFAISGFFILKSFDRRHSALQFVAARVGRTMPGLMLVTAFTTAISFCGISFAANPLPDHVNGSLWTLWFEGVCYLALLCAGVAGLYCKGRFGAFLISYGMIYGALWNAFVPLTWGWAYASLSLPFVVGMAAYHYRSWFPLDWRIAGLLMVLATVAHRDALWSIGLGYAALCFGASFPFLRVYNRLGDYSYGTYIFGWPVQQILVLTLPGIRPGVLMFTALPIAWALAMVSWALVEEPAIQAVGRLFRSRRLTALATNATG